MSVTSAAAVRRSTPVGLLAALIVLGGAALWFIVKSALHYTDYSLESYTAYYWPRRAALIPHITGGLMAISTGLVQLWLGLTNRVGPLHRSLGKVYATGVLIGALGGYAMALTIPAKYFVYGAGLFTLCTAWVITTGMALYSIRRRAIEQHREWMTRSYTVTFAFVSFRLVEKWLMAWKVAPDDDIDALLAWACWAVPLLIVEPFIQLRKLRARRTVPLAR